MSNSKVSVCVVTILYVVLVLICLFRPADEFSASERRKLAQKPQFTWESFTSGKFAGEAESYATDQFPFRDAMRSLKAEFSLNIMQKADTNDIFVKDGYLCAMEYPMEEDSIIRAAKIFEGIYEKYLQDSEVNAYFSVIPDKSYFLAGKDYLSMDYELFFAEMYEQTPFLMPIPIEKNLQLSDYYRTDTHWKQEEITDVAHLLAKEMGVQLAGSYEVKTLDVPFYGVYYGQAAVAAEPDAISYCTNDVLDNCTVFDYENNKAIPLYDIEKVKGRDPYEMFLGGNISLVTVTNPAATSDKELVVFGDSFARSMVPLLAEGYAKTTMIDIRYLPSAYIGNYVTFSSQDVLFLYSTSVLNNSITLK